MVCFLTFNEEAEQYLVVDELERKRGELLDLSKLSVPPARWYDPRREFLNECTCRAPWEQLDLRGQ